MTKPELFNGPTTQALTQALNEFGYYVQWDGETVQDIIAGGVKNGGRGQENVMRAMDFDPRNIEKVLLRSREIRRALAGIE